MNDATLSERIEAGNRRIEKVVLDGHVLWIKRPENLTLRMRLQKGDPLVAFADEVAAHQALAAKGLPVAPIVSAGPDHIVTEDCGKSVLWFLRNGPASKVPAIIRAAATALSELHAAGVAHSRPNLKDICWDNGRITFLDFERTGRDTDIVRARQMDVLIFLFSITVETGGSVEAMRVARDTYRSAQPDVWKGAVTRLRRYLPLRYAIWPVTWAMRGKKEFGAVGPFFQFVLE